MNINGIKIKEKVNEKYAVCLITELIAVFSPNIMKSKFGKNIINVNKSIIMLFLLISLFTLQ